MKIQYWGTAAAEGIPGTFCNCKTCVEARKRGGRNVRYRAQALIDDELLIDFGPDTYASAMRFGCNLADIGYVLITHPHEDHFAPCEFYNRQVGFSHGMKHETLRIYGSSAILPAFYTMAGPLGQRLINQQRVAFETLKPFVTVKIDGYNVTPFKANHGTFEPFVYAVEKDGKAILYLHDTGIPADETFKAIETLGTKYDLVSYDCTHSAQEVGPNGGHMGIPDDIVVRARLDKLGVLKPGAIAVVNHFSHNGTSALYDELVPVAEKEGFIVSYDGLTLEF